jgi:glycosyltransferase involved in cell wall biosynthesis
METLAAGVWRSLLTVRPGARKISHGGKNRDLVWWFPLSIVRLALLIVSRRMSFVLTGDALTYAVVRPLLWVFRVPSATMILGLDVTYENRLYQAIVRTPLRAAPAVIAISAATADRARESGVPPERISVLRLGVRTPPTGTDRDADTNALRRRLGLGNEDLLLLTLGRLVRRKGVRWFCEFVMPGLAPHVHYLVAGDGPDEGGIRAAAERAGVTDRVHQLGRVTDAEFEELMGGADVFVQPNIAVPGDIEGFGLVTVEAAMRGNVVLAADIEGLRDAVDDGETGILIRSGDADAWTEQLNGLPADRDELRQLGIRFQRRARELYSEEAMGRELMVLLNLDA